VVDSLKELDFQLNSKSVLSVDRIKKLKLSIECSLPHWSNFVVEEFPMCSVEELKNKISKRRSILPKQFDLVYKNRLLDDNILLESIIEQNASLELKINENRIIFKLYLHKGLPNRSNIDMFKNFVHVKVDEPEEEELGDITRSFAQILQLQESDLHITRQGFYLDKNQKYSDCNVYDGSILCICCCENSIRENNSQHTQTIFQADPSGFFEKGNIHIKMIITIRVINLIKKEFIEAIVCMCTCRFNMGNIIFVIRIIRDKTTEKQCSPCKTLYKL
jgi:hypothetical protein